MKSPMDTLIGLAWLAAAGLVWYLLKRFDNFVKPIPPGAKPPAAPKPGKKTGWRSRLVLNVAIAGAIIGLLYGIPEYNGRRDATAMCEAIPVGTRMDTSNEALFARRDEFRQQHGTFFAASYFQKHKGHDDGNGAIVMVFLAGYPFSRAYCVLHLNEFTVRSKQIMFNAEDYEYCDGQMRGIWECTSKSGETRQ